LSYVEGSSQEEIMKKKELVPPPKVLVVIRSLDDLSRVLHTQKMIAAKAKKEFASIDSSNLDLNKPNENRLFEYIRQEKELLEKWSLMPTLTEFNQAVSQVSEDGKWGGTFGVAVLVQDIVLEQVYNQQKRLKPLLRKILMVMLNHLEKEDTNRGALDQVLAKIKLTATADRQGINLSKSENYTIVRKMMGQMVDTFLAVGCAFGLFENEGFEFKTTPCGARVYWHMVDIQRFIEILTESHRAFQKEKPKLNFV
jgi:hypothetical protein